MTFGYQEVFSLGAKLQAMKAQRFACCLESERGCRSESSSRDVGKIDLGGFVRGENSEKSS